jgi:hypothetical protein
MATREGIGMKGTNLYRVALVLPALVFGAVAVAEEAASPPNVVHDPDLGSPSRADEDLQPEVRIIDRGADRVEEYRRNGQLYMIKVIPSKGFPYYLMDTDGDGQLETRRNDLDPDVVVPRWTLFRF